MRVEFLPEAEADLDRLFHFLLERSSWAAQRAMSAIDDAIEQLKANPRLGTVLESSPEFRRVPVVFGRYGYVLQYRIQEDAVVVVRIWQGREQR
ncbi:MAG: type II toxin-antitoxin system RelE/ParE family toxin [Pseudomonadota bacterium]